MSNVAHDLSVLYILIEDLSKDYFHLLRAKGCRRNRCLVYGFFFLLFRRHLYLCFVTKVYEIFRLFFFRGMRVLWLFVRFPVISAFFLCFV